MADSDPDYGWVKNHEAIEGLRDEARHLGEFLELQRLRAYLAPKGNDHDDFSDTDGEASATG